MESTAGSRRTLPHASAAKMTKYAQKKSPGLGDSCTQAHSRGAWCIQGIVMQVSLWSQTVRGRSGDYCHHSVDSAGILALPITAILPIIGLMRKFNPGRTTGVVALWAIVFS